MKKILFIINCFSLGGGAEALLTTIVNNLDPEKYDISIIEFVHYSVKEEKTNCNIKVLPYIVNGEDTEERRHQKYLLFHDTDNYIKQHIPEGYDLYIGFNYLAPAYLLPPGKNNILWIHGDVYDCLQEPMLIEEHDQQNQMYNKAKKIIVISDRTEKSVLDVFPEQKDKLVKIYNGIDTEKVRRLSEEDADISVMSPAVAVVGRLDNNKNPLRAVRILRLLHDMECRCHMYFIGDGKLHEDVRALSKEEGLEEYVHLTGYLENPFPVMKGCDCMLMTSGSEGFQMSLLESLTLGVPFISTDVGASRMLVNEDNKCMVFEQDNSAAKGIYERLHETDKEDVARECRNTALKYDIEKYIEKIERVLDSIGG
ncbi:MAG: glycosyltransferase [Acetatifactor sp.]|nr:glycosyltransferase [Acetatifactor sp.]